MGHDDFPEEDTNPGTVRPVSPGGFAPQTGGHAPVQQHQYHPQAQHPQAQHPQAQHPQAQHPQAQHPQAQHPQAQHPQAQHPQAQHPQAQYPQAQYPQVGGQQVYNQTGGQAAQQNPATGGFAAVHSPAPVPVLHAPLVQPAEEKASRVVYGMSGMAFGGMMGVALGVINTFAEGLTITEGTEFIMGAALWCAFLVGVLAFWKPDRFDSALDRLQTKFGPEQDNDPDRTMD